MENISDLNRISTRDYSGCILSGDYSVELKKRVAEYIDHYRVFEDTGSAAILYIAAWQGEKEKIWYEYASRDFTNLLGCKQHEIGEVFRKCIMDRRIYKDLDVGDGVQKEVISHVLKKTGWNRSKATKILKISYKTLLYKISDLGIVPPAKTD